MASTISLRGRNDKKPVFKKAKAGAGAYCGNDDSMTIMDVIRTVKKPTPKQEREQQTRVADCAAGGEKEYHEVVLDATAFSSSSDEDLGRVVCQYKRKRKCMDLSDILKRDDPTVVDRLTSDRPQDENSQPRKAKKLEPIRKGHNLNADGNGRHKLAAESRPPSSAAPNSKAIQGHLKHCTGSPVGHQTDSREIMDTMKFFSDSLGLSKPVPVTDVPALIVGKRQSSRAAAVAVALRPPRSPISKVGRKAGSSSQPAMLQKSASAAYFLPFSASSLHTCADAKNCQNACVAKAVAPNLDHMSEEELIYWCEQVTKNKFTCRNGEKVRGRIRRVIRAEVKRAAALTKTTDDRNNSNISPCDEARKWDPSFLEPRTPSPGNLVVDIHLQDSPLAREFPASIGSKENISCAFNSAASFEDYVSEESARTSPNRSEALAGAAVLLKDGFELLDCRLSTEEGLALNCAPLGIALVIDEPSAVEIAESKSIPINIALDVNHGPESRTKLEIECGDTQSPSSKRTLTEKLCGVIVNRSSDSPEGQSLLPSAESELKRALSLGTVDSYPRNVELKVSEDVRPVLNTSRIEENESTSHQPSAGSPRESMDCVLNFGAAELSTPVVDEDITLPIMQDCGIEEDPSVRLDEEMLPKMGPGSSLSLIVNECAVSTPNLRPSSLSREQRSADSQENEITSHQPSSDSTRESMDCVSNSGAGYLSAPAVDEDITLPIIQECRIEEDPSVRSDEKMSSKMGPGSSLSLIASECAVFIPNLRLSSPSREQWSVDSQEENEINSHQPSADSTRESMDCVPNSVAAELSTTAVNDDIILPIIQQECRIEDHLSVRSDEEKSPKMEPGSSLSLIASERVLFTPNLRPSSPSREQESAYCQEGTSLPACDTRATTGHADPVNSPKKNPCDALEIARDLKPNCDDRVTPIQAKSNFAAPATKGDENGEESLADSSQGEKFPRGLFNFQETAPALRDLEDQITKPIDGISKESETSQGVVGICCTSESQQSVDCLNQLVLVDTSGCSRDVEVSVQDDSQLSSAVVEEQNTVGKLAGVCEISLDDGSQQAGSCCTSESQQYVDRLNQLVLVHTSGCSMDVEVSVQDDSQLSCVVVEKQITVGKLAAVGKMSLDYESPVKGIDRLAETCSAANKVKGIDEGGLQSCHISLMDSDIAGDEIGVWDAKNVPTLQNLPVGSETEDRVLSLEEYIAVHRGKDAASQELEEDVTAQELEEDVASELIESQGVSDEGQGDATKDELVEDFATCQMMGSVACCQKSDNGNDHVEGILKRDPNEDAAPHELEEDVTTQGLEQDVASEQIESQHVSGEVRGDATKDEFVDEFATQEMLGSVACCQKSDAGSDHVEGIPSPNGIDTDEDLAVIKMKDMDISQEIQESTRNNSGEEISTQQLAMDITSQRVQIEVLSQFREECDNQAKAEFAPTETEGSTSEDLEGDGTGQAKEKAVLSCLNPEDGNTVCFDEGAVILEYEEDVTARKMVNCANQLDGDLCAKDVTVPDPEEDVGCKAMEEGGTAIEVDEVFATQETVEMALASEQRPREVFIRSSIEEDTTPQDSEKNQHAPYLDELGASQRIQDSATQELEEESSLQLDGDITQGEHDSPRSGGGGLENQANLNVAPSQVAGVDVPHFEKDTVSRRKEETALQSLGENGGHDQIAETSDACFSGPGSTLSLDEVVSLHQMYCSDVSTINLGEDGSDHVEDFVELRPAHGVVEVRDDHTGSADHVNDVATANNFCEKAGEDSLDYPVVLSQPRRSETEDDIQETVTDVQRTTPITTLLSRRITRSSLKLEKSISELVRNLAGSFKSSSSQSPGANSVLPHRPDTCASDRDPQRRERTKTSLLAPADQSRPPTASLSLASEAEIEQINNFEYAILQEEEWQNAGKFSNQIDMSFFEEDLAVSSPRKRKFNDPENDSDRGKRVAVETPLQDDTFASVQENTSERAIEGNSMEDEHVPTALSKAMIEKNGERSGAIYTFPISADQESPVTEQQPIAKQKPERMIAREKRKVLLEHSPESNCDSATAADSNGCNDLLACEKLSEEESSQDFEPPSKLLCRRKTISPVSQLELMRASNRNSPPSDDSPIQKIPAFRLRLPPGQDSHRGRPSPFEREPTPRRIYLDPSNKTGKDEASNGIVVSLDSSEDDTDDSCSRQELGSRGSRGEPPRKFSLCLSPTSPESVRSDSSPDVSTQEHRDSQSIDAPSSKGILKTGPQACRGLCKCAECSASRSNAEHAAEFIASQMRTFQKIAGHLTEEMQGLRAMLETNLSSPEETGKIQEALKKAKDVEEAQEKKLVTLLRDCKRYCKLTASKPILMRKIVFADEAGKKLCHVKSFKSQSLPKSALDRL